MIRPAMAAALMTVALPLLAAHVPSHPPANATHPGVTTSAQTDGEIRKIDKEAGKVTIKHGPITNLGMPAMTMAFRVKDPAMLDSVKVGDAIKFKADKVDGNYTVTEFAPAKK